MKKIYVVEVPDYAKEIKITATVDAGSSVGDTLHTLPYTEFILPTDEDAYQAFGDYRKKFPTSIIQVAAFIRGIDWFKSLLQ